MGWQLINSVVKAITGENEIVQSVGYMYGTDNEDGCFCFHRGPYHAEKPFIAEEFCPHIDFGGYTYRQIGFLFNNRPVFKNDNAGYIFYSAKEGAWIGGLQDSTLSMNNIREPYYYTDLDGETVKGDVFYKGNFPELNESPINWTKSGSTEFPNLPETKQAEMKQNFWEWNTNGSIPMNQSGLCGKYKNAEDDSWKFVGIPKFQVIVERGQSCYYTNEKFTRSWEKETSSRKYVYEGDKGHTIKYESGVWVLGTQGQGKWSQGDDEPSLTDPVSFQGYQIDEGSGEPTTDPEGNFVLSWYGMVLGDKKNNVLMGEVSLWRSEIE